MAVVVVACGGGAGAPPPRMAPSQGPGSDVGHASHAYAPPPPEYAPRPAPQPSGAAPVPPRGTVQPSHVSELDALARGFDRDERALDASAADCGTACRALGSMERATVQLCAIAEQPDDQKTCDDARRRLLLARDRVRNTCNVCVGGPSVEHDAPIPSTPAPSP